MGDLFQVYILTLFPDFFNSLCQYSLFQRACAQGILHIDIINIRDFSVDKHHKCDDLPYGGGSGMVMTPQPVWAAMDSIPWQDYLVLGMSARGVLLQQKLVEHLARQTGLPVTVSEPWDKDNLQGTVYENLPAKWKQALFDSEKIKKKPGLVLICGHYEGMDQRVWDYFCDFELSIGDYILSGGEAASIVVLEAVLRYLPGFLGNRESLTEESFNDDLLEYPQYTRPADYAGLSVPEVLLSGHHAQIKKWRHEQSLDQTRRIRPDLWHKFIDRT